MLLAPTNCWLNPKGGNYVYIEKLILSPLLSILWILSLFVQPLQAAATDPFTDDMPTFESKAEEGTDYNTGDWGVAEQNGAVTYTYPVSVPTGRNGMKPSLLLRYSSTSSLRGGLAVGWSLDVPSIRVDNSLGIEAHTIYRASLGNVSGRLVHEDDLVPIWSGAYRVDFDESFTRFFRLASEDILPTWQAWTTDGVHHEFGNEDLAGDKEYFWPITRQTDSFGNIVRYFWAKTSYGYFVSYDLTRIEYTANERAGLAAYAKIDFVYNDELRCDGAPMPVGAAPMVANILSGARQLNAINISVRDTNANWRLSRQVKLTHTLDASRLYQEEESEATNGAANATTNAAPQINCNGQAQLRYLTQIQETGFSPDGVSTTLPPLTFEYNYRQRGPGVGREVVQPPGGLTNTLTRTVTVPGFALAGNSQKGILTSLLDIDSDGVNDRASVILENERCVLGWNKGQLGGAFDPATQKSPLPTMPWYYQTDPDEAVNGLVQNEGCSFSGQVVYRERHEQIGTGNEPVREQGMLVYKFIDYSSDGRIDLLTQLTGSLVGEEFPDAYSIQVTTPEHNFNVSTAAIWFIFRNDRELHYPGNDGIFSQHAFSIESPIPLGGTASEINVDNFTKLKGMPTALFDIDGDGFLDAVIHNQGGPQPTHNIGGCYGNTITPPFWCVFFGNGKNFGGGYRWAIPESEYKSFGINGRICQRQENGTPQKYHDLKWEIAALNDVDGDGLVDLVRREADQTIPINCAEMQSNQFRLRVYRNLGRGFASQAIDLGTTEPIEILQTDFEAISQNTFVDGSRGYRRRLLDLDHDGLVDILFTKDDDTADRNDITRRQKVYAAFNLGGYFSTATRILPEFWLVGKRLVHTKGIYSQNNWWIENDFYDATGDGLPDLASFTNNGRTMQVIGRPGLPAAPDLLRAVDNGRGLRLEFYYTASTAGTAVQWDTKNFKLNHAKWVVSEIRKIDKFSTSPHITRYSYKDPVSHVAKANAAFPEPGYFVGFASVTRTEYDSTNTPLNRVLHGYRYNLVPDGYLASERLFRAENGDFKPHSFTTHEWTLAPLFGGKFSFAYPSLSLTRTCLPGATEAACATQNANIFRSQGKWTAVYAATDSQCHTESANTASAILYVPTLSQSGSSLTLETLDRRTKQCFQIRYGHPGSSNRDYRILPTESVREVVVFDTNGLRFETSGRSKTYYSADFGLPYQFDVWQDAETVATTKVTYDTLTGNLSSTTKPKQAADGTAAKRTNYTYDAHRLFIQTTTNELGHQLITTYDLATGALLERRGPNFVQIANAQRAWEREAWRIDGFGRVLEYAISLDAANNSYRSQTVAKTSYFDNELPNRVRNLQLLDLDGSRWITAEQQFSGVGSVLTATHFLDGNLTTITSYRYDSTGNLITNEMPDPRSDDGARVQYTYAYDGLARLTQFTRPDQNGVAIAYAGLEKTISEVTHDASGASKKEVYDVLGRLVELHEFDPAAAPLSPAINTMATTIST